MQAHLPEIKLEEFKQLLEQGANPNEILPDGKTLLQFVIKLKIPEIAQMLITHQNIQIDALNKQKQTALHYATLEPDFPEITLLLLQHHANPNLQDYRDRTPLHYAIGGECLKGNAFLKKIRILFTKKLNLELKDDKGISLLEYIDSNHIFKKIIASDDKLYKKYLETALLHATEQRNIQAMTTLDHLLKE